MSTLLPILGISALFVVFGLFRPKRGACGSECGSCEGTSCTYTESQDESR
jgi:hypothetical protein